MTEVILRIYTYIKTHRATGLLSCMLITMLLLLSVSQLSYKEDIADFLPIDSRHHNALKVYQDISGAGKMFAIFQYSDSTKTNPDVLTASVDRFVEEVEKADTAHEVQNLMAEVDLEKMTTVTDFVYQNIPYFLTDADYARMDSALSQPGFVAQQMQADKQMLMFPTGSILSDNIQRDPLNLFTPTVQKLQRASSGLSYEMYEGHIFSPDMQRAIVMMDSPYGSSETEHNGQLIDKLRQCAQRATASVPEVEVHIIGGPVIAVGNASQIKQDSILSVLIAVVLILALLFVSFRNWRNLLLIVLSIAWGWLFAMGGLALVHDRVSIIVVGISSVILGIAVNYPLHFIAHLSHTPDKRKALREIVMPLLVGNITTVGAFLTLVPLQSIALRDLGLFSSFLLVGTILFVLIYLPHLSKVSKTARPTFLDRIGEVKLENKPWVVAVVVVLTVVFGYFSLQTQFDANMGHINYMTDEQKADMAYFQKTMTPNGSLQKVYAISQDSTLDGALDKSLQLQPHLQQLRAGHQIEDYASCNQFLCSRKEQQRRLALWQDFLRRHAGQLRSELAAEGIKEGFAKESFDDFMQILGGCYGVQPASYFDPLARQVFASNISADSNKHIYNVVNILSVNDGDVERVEKLLDQKGCYSFDVVSMNSAIANHLSNDFNYIGFACGFIVFFFLWLSMGSIELAMLSFLPMAVSWLWILGIMALCGMQFNIVNIILATFIFGQGDDYTIFMTEGSMYEYAYRRKMLASYKHSIIVSALIMFIGIGTLIIARHPALRSLAEVTIAGMFSVVLMAYIFPPLIFRWLVQTRSGGYRRRPLSLVPLLRMVWAWLCGGRLSMVPGVNVRVDDLRADGSTDQSAHPGRILVCQPMASLHPLARRWLQRRGVLTSTEEAVGKAREQHAVLQPVVIHGLDHMMADDAFALHRGTVSVRLLPAIAPAEADADALQQLLATEYDRLARREETAAYWHDMVLDRYRYKGTEVYGAVAKALKKTRCYADRVDVAETGTEVVLNNDNQGEMALLYALVHPCQQVTVVEPDEELRALITYSAEIAGNLKCVERLS